MLLDTLSAMGEPPTRLEVCVEDLEGARCATRGGADRIELCADLSVGGVTPSVETLRTAREECGIAIVSMVRPRGGDFAFDAGELEQMERDIEVAKDLGMDGVVLGVLDPSHEVDRRALDRLVRRADRLPVTFHRAFDETPDPDAALEVLIESGVARLLTSGQARTALEGVPTLARLCERAAGRIVVMPGGNVRRENVGEIVRRTKARDVHSSVGGAETITADAVRALVNTIRDLEGGEASRP